MSEHIKAKHWRKEIAKLSLEELAEATGYARSTIAQMETGRTSEGQPINKYVWQRYRLTCAAAMLAPHFDWS